MSNVDFLARNFIKTLVDVQSKKSAPYDTQAEVRRVDGDTAWVHIPGGVDETPVQLTTNAKKGDIVQVRVSGGRAWLYGNATSPPTDDTKADKADQKAAKALETMAVIDNRVVEAEVRIGEVESNIGGLETRVGTAEGKITTVEGDITNLQGRVIDAEEDIDDTLKGLALAQNVIGTLAWITAHSKVTTDQTPVSEKAYYIKNQDGTYTIVTDTTGKIPVSEGWYEMDEAMENYIALHLAMTNDGLVVTKDNSKWKVLVKDNGIDIIDGTGGLNKVVASYGSGISFDSTRQFTIGNNNTYITFDPSNGGSIFIGGGNNVSIGSGKTLDEVITKEAMVRISANSINWDATGNMTAAILTANLYMDGILAGNNVLITSYAWYKDIDPTPISGATTNQLTVTGDMGLNHIYDCAITWTEV